MKVKEKSKKNEDFSKLSIDQFFEHMDNEIEEAQEPKEVLKVKKKKKKSAQANGTETEEPKKLKIKKKKKVKNADIDSESGNFFNFQANQFINNS